MSVTQQDASISLYTMYSKFYFPLHAHVNVHRREVSRDRASRLTGDSTDIAFCVLSK